MLRVVENRRFWLNFFVFLLLISVLNSCTGVNRLEITNASFNSIEVNSTIQTDSNIFKKITPYKDSLDQIINEVIGQSAQKMEVGYPEGLLGNFVADILLSTANNLEGFKADFAISNNGGLRNSIPAGNVSIKNIFELMPFDNEIVVLEITADILNQLLNYIALRQSDELSVSGLNITIKNKEIKTAFVDHVRIDQNKTYFLVISDYLANGGSNMFFLKNAVSKKETGIKVRDAIIDYIKINNALNQSVNAEIDGRIRILE